MLDRQAVVTLHPLFQPDTLPFRSLTLASDSDHVDIGRASKREAKNLAPAHHNACFDSRVMSRNHARLGVCVDKKTVLIRDGGSMHGTWVNDRKISVNQDTAINSGDILTFGADVTRGTETFPPLRVRCECEWFDSSYDDPKSNDMTNQGINSFCVPDDDDSDVVEVVDESVPAKPISTENHGSEDSDQSLEAENHTPQGNSTPITSPSNKGISSGLDSKLMNSLEISDDDDSEVDGTSYSPIVLDGEPLATPRMTPLHILNSNPVDELISDINIGSRADHDSDCASSIADFPNGDQYYDGGGLIDYTDESDYGAGYPNSELGSLVGSDSSDDESDAAGSEGDSGSEDEGSRFDDLNGNSQPKGDCRSQDTNADAPSIVERKEFPFSNADHPIFHPRNIGQSQNDSDNFPLESLWPISNPDAAPSSSLQPNDKPFAPRLPSLYTLSSNGWEPQTIRYSPTPFDIRAPAGTQVRHTCVRHVSHPVMKQQPQSVEHNLSSHGNLNDVPSAKDGIHYADNGWFNAEPQQPEKSSYLQQSSIFSKPMQDIPQADREPTRVSIADIVDTLSPEASTTQGPSLKRKAVDEEPHPVAASLYTSDTHPVSLETCKPANAANNDTYSQDAQPRPSMGDLGSTQLTDVQCMDQPKSDSEQARPSKRVKTSQETRGRGIASYAATAIASAVVGGLGTIALLASLPPDYFV